MLKSIMPILAALLLSATVQAASFQEGKTFISQPETVAGVPRVLHFFSFYCPGCYQYEEKLHVNETIKKNLPEGVKEESYHVGYLGPMGQELTRAWAVAILMGVEDKVVNPLFKAVQKSHTLKTESDIRQIFIDAGISGEEYDTAWNSFAVNALVQQQNSAAEKLKVDSIPAVYVDGKYRIIPQGFDQSSAGAFVKSYSDTVNHLLSLKSAS
ncbi:MAG: DsbA family protein [Acinetobacter sp.]